MTERLKLVIISSYDAKVEVFNEAKVTKIAIDHSRVISKNYYIKVRNELVRANNSVEGASTDSRLEVESV